MTPMIKALPLLLLAAPAAAIELRLPVACELGSTCYVQQGFDHDPGPGAADARCGTLSYDGHTGTDLALPTLADQARGVDVLAAAAGVVAGARDGMADAIQGSDGAPDVSGRECGNGVLIRHEGGWETQYCHMAEGSVAVREGERVEAGAVLGRVGYSGEAQFPHLELTVRRDGVAVDPFAPEAAPDVATGAASCALDPAADLWAADLPFPAGGVTDAGFATDVPDYAAVRAGTADRPLGRDAPLVLFALVFGGREGDVVRLVVEGPGGEVIARDESLTRTQALLFRAAGLRAPPGGWDVGAYRGTATLLRDGEPVGAMEAEAALP